MAWEIRDDNILVVMVLSYKYRIYPTKAQEEFLNWQLAEACELYNAALQERRDAWKTCRKSVGYYYQKNQLPAMRKDGCLKMVNAQSACNVLWRVDRAFRSFFRRSSGNGGGYPRFKSKRRYTSITFPSYGNGCRILPNRKLYVQGAGHIKMRLHRPTEGEIKTATIKRDAGRWFVIFVSDVDPKPLPISTEAVGIDVGLTTFATLSDGTEVQNPRYYRNAQARLRRCQRKVARRKKGSNRRRKAVALLQKAHAHVRNQRADFHHKVSRDLVNRYGVIVVEDLNVKELAGGMLAKSVNDAGWSSFIQKLTYKAESAGRELVKVDPKGTSQTCECGAEVPKALGDRWHHCPACGVSMDRDHMSAKVILQRARNAPSGANVGAVRPSVAREAA